MNLPKELTTVTKTSKTLAYIVFLTLPFIGFFLGIKYQQTLDLANQQTTEPVIIKRTPTPTPSQIIDTSNWKTYTSKSYEFSFQYPPDYKVNHESSLALSSDLGTSSIVLSLEPLNYKGSYVTEDPGIYFILTRINKNTVLNEWLKELYKKSGAQVDYQLTTIGIYDAAVRNIVITPEIKAAEIIKKFAGGGGLPIGYKAKHVYIKKGDLIFEIETGNINNPDDIIKRFDQILQTFKFLDQTNGAEGKACGGFAGETGQFVCPTGYKCQYPKPMYPDAQGKCVKI